MPRGFFRERQMARLASWKRVAPWNRLLKLVGIGPGQASRPGEGAGPGARGLAVGIGIEGAGQGLDADVVEAAHLPERPDGPSESLALPRALGAGGGPLDGGEQVVVLELQGLQPLDLIGSGKKEAV